jgi:hypothetical protein
MVAIGALSSFSRTRPEEFSKTPKDLKKGYAWLVGNPEDTRWQRLLEEL